MGFDVRRCRDVGVGRGDGAVGADVGSAVGVGGVVVLGGVVEGVEVGVDIWVCVLEEAAEGGGVGFTDRFAVPAGAF